MIYRPIENSGIGRVLTTESGKIVVECKATGFFYLYDANGIYTGESWSEIEFEEYSHLILEKY